MPFLKPAICFFGTTLSLALCACGGVTGAGATDDVSQHVTTGDGTSDGEPVDASGPTDPGAPGTVTVIPGARGCASLDAAACSGDCRPITSTDGVFRGCMSSRLACGAAFTCGVGPDGEQATFRNTCLPAGWNRC